MSAAQPQHQQLLRKINQGAASTEPTVCHDNLDRWLRRPYGSSEREAHAQALRERTVIPCPCGRCTDTRAEELAIQQLAGVGDAVERVRQQRHELRVERFGLWLCQLYLIGYIAILRTRRGWRWLRDLPARFEAWVESVDASRFIRVADTVCALVFTVLAGLFVGGLLVGLVAIILEGRP